MGFIESLKYTIPEYAHALTSSGHFGWSIDVSADGTTAIIGHPGADSNLGAAHIFIKSGSTWVWQAKLS